MSTLNPSQPSSQPSSQPEPNIPPESEQPQTPDERFQTGQVMTIVGGHFVHDTFSAFLAPLLPLLINKLSLSLTLAGSLQIFIQGPALLNPFIGYLADKISLRYFVILAPAFTATLMSLLGLAPNYWALAVLLFLTGISVACFHAPTPGMVARVSGFQVGRGMSFYMAGGELGRTIGPLLITWAVATFTLEGSYRLMVLGWFTSLILYWRLRSVAARTEPPQGVRAMLPTAARVFLPIIGIVLPRAFLIIPIQVYLPTYMNFQEGSSLIGAGLALTVWELAGVGGALLGGTLSDRFGRRIVLYLSLSVAPLLSLLFLQMQGIWLWVILFVHGFFALSTNPVLLAIVQEHLPRNRAMGNGLFLATSFLVRPLVSILIGFIGDQLGLGQAYFWGAIIAFLSIPAVFYLPKLPQSLEEV